MKAEGITGAVALENAQTLLKTNHAPTFKTQDKINRNNTTENDNIDIEIIDENLDTDSTKDGLIGTTKQQLTGDCWLLSGVNGLSYTEKGAEIIKNALKADNKNGESGTTVHLEGLNTDYFISDKELNEIKKNKTMSKKYSKGDDDMIILEMAVEKARNDISNGNIVIKDDVDFIFTTSDIFSEKSANYLSTRSGNSLEMIYFLSGKVGDRAVEKDEQSNLLNRFIENGGKDYALTASINKGNTKNNIQDIYGNTIRLPGGHAYSVKKADENSVTVIDPYDSGNEIVISKEQFLEYFDRVYGCDLTDNNQKQNLTVETTSKIKKNKNGTKTKVVKDLEGNVLGKYTFEDGIKSKYKTYDEIDDKTTTIYYDSTGPAKEVAKINDDETLIKRKVQYDKNRNVKNISDTVIYTNDDGTIDETQKVYDKFERLSYYSQTNYNEGGSKTKFSLDKNKDGKIDYVEYYRKNGELKKSKTDEDGDGKFDYIDYYNKKGDIKKTKKLN